MLKLYPSLHSYSAAVTLRPIESQLSEASQLAQVHHNIAQSQLFPPLYTNMAKYRLIAGGVCFLDNTFSVTVDHCNNPLLLLTLTLFFVYVSSNSCTCCFHVRLINSIRNTCFVLFFKIIQDSFFVLYIGAILQGVCFIQFLNIL